MIIACSRFLRVRLCGRGARCHPFLRSADPARGYHDNKYKEHDQCRAPCPYRQHHCQVPLAPPAVPRAGYDRPCQRGLRQAALQADLSLGNAAFALAGIFFIGYALFEVPSNLMLHQVGARVWLSRIMITWGFVSAAMMFSRDETTFYVLRFLLGVAEAGFSPRVILYLTYWFPAARRGQAIGIYYFGLPCALLLGSPLSGWLLDMHGMFGLTSWQWMFLVEGLAAVVVGCVVLFYLDSKLHEAK